MANAETYTTYGSVTGDCGHSHKTHQSASQCATKHERGCKSQGGYSDRAVYRECDLLRNAVGDVYMIMHGMHDSHITANSIEEYISAGFDRGGWD